MTRQKFNTQNLILTLTLMTVTLSDFILARPQSQADLLQQQHNQTVPNAIEDEKQAEEQHRQVLSEQISPLPVLMFGTPIINNPADLIEQANERLKALKQNITNGANVPSPSLPSPGLLSFPSIVMTPFTVTPSPTTPSPQPLQPEKPLNEEVKKQRKGDDSSAIIFPDDPSGDSDESNMNTVDPMGAENVEMTTISLVNRVVLVAPNICSTGEMYDSHSKKCRRVLGK